jgi:hypothetical protein
VTIDDSAKWRVSTVQRLQTFNSPENDASVKQRLLAQLAELLKDLGYEALVEDKSSKLESNLGDLFDKAIEFARLVAGQRAVFEASHS